MHKPKEEEIEYYEALDFSIIQGDIKEFLEFIPTLLGVDNLAEGGKELNDDILIYSKVIWCLLIIEIK